MAKVQIRGMSEFFLHSEGKVTREVGGFTTVVPSEDGIVRLVQGKRSLVSSIDALVEAYFAPKKKKIPRGRKKKDSIAIQDDTARTSTAGAGSSEEESNESDNDHST